MFPLHDRTRRWICRSLFLLCAVLPTFVVLGWCVWMRSPNRTESVRTRLEAALGLSVRLTNVTYPRPGCTLLKDVELADVDAGRTVASARLVEISDDSQGDTIFASQPEIDISAAEHVMRLIQEALLRPINSPRKELRLAAGELTLRCSNSAQTFVNCSAQLQSNREGSVANASLQLANTKATQPIHIQWQRSYASREPVTHVNIRADSAIPAWLLAALLQEENHLGPRCTLDGALAAMETPDGWQIEFAGRLKNVDLHWLISDQFPHLMSGNAELNIEHAIIHAGRLEELRGTIHAGPGTVSRSLLAAAVASLGLRSDEFDQPHAKTSNVISYEEFAAQFALDGNGLAIRGQCDGKPNGIVMRSRDGVLLADSSRGPVPVVALVKMLVPDSRVQVPATRQTDWLLNLLPVPDIVPGDPQAVPQARFRGGKDLR